MADSSRAIGVPPIVVFVRHKRGSPQWLTQRRTQPQNHTTTRDSYQDPLETLVLVAAKGSFPKAPATGDYETRNTILPPSLVEYLNQPATTQDPFYIDVRDVAGEPLPKTEYKHKIAQIVASLQNSTLREVLKVEQRRRNRTVSALVVVAVITTMLSLATSLLFLEAREQTAAAGREADRAVATAYAAQAELLLDTDPMTALALAVESMATTDSPSPEAIRALNSARSAIENYDHRMVGKLDEPYQNSVLTSEFSPDGSMVAVAGADRVVGLWEVSTGLLIGELYGHASAVWDVTWSPDGATIALVDTYGNLLLWDPIKQQQIGGHPESEFDTDTLSTATVEYSPDGALIATSGQSGVRLWDSHTGRQLGEPLTEPGSWYPTVRFSPDGLTLASGNRDNNEGVLFLWDVETRKQTGKAIPLSNDSSDTWEFNPTGSNLATIGPDGVVTLRNPRTGDPLILEYGEFGTLETSSSDRPAIDLSFSLDGTKLFTLTTRDKEDDEEDDEIRNHVTEWNGETGRYVSVGDWTIPNTINGIGRSSDGRTLLASAPAESTGTGISFDLTQLIFLDIETGEETAPRIISEANPVSWFGFDSALIGNQSPDGSKFLASHSGEFRMWSIDSSKDRRHLVEEPNFSLLGPDFSKFLSVQEESLVLRDTGSGQIVHEINVSAYAGRHDYAPEKMLLSIPKSNLLKLIKRNLISSLKIPIG